jgi:two-component system, NtrC family, sensor kinase
MTAGLSLRARLGLAAAAVVAAVVGVTAVLENRTVGVAVEAEAMEAAAATATGVAGELAERDAFPSEDELDALLSEFTRAEPALESLTVTSAGTAPVLVTTADVPPEEALPLAARATQAGARVASASGAGPLHYVAVPLAGARLAGGAVVVGVSLEPARRVRAQSQRAAALFAAVAIVAMVAALDLLARRLVLRPLGALRSVMSRASAGDLAARVTPERGDEIGAVGAGLNDMLERLSDFNAALREEVLRRTADLQTANDRLADSAQRLFSARTDLARSEQLAAAGRMAAEMAHQIGTPLNLVSGHVQLLLADHPEGSREGAKLRTVHEQIGRVIAIVQGLLDEARRPVLHKRLVSPAALLSGVADLVRPTLAAARIDLTVEAPSLPPLALDAGAVEQALLNLVTNSVDAMPDGGRLGLSAHAIQDGVELVVSDDGQGLSPLVLAHAFDPLFTTKPPGRGTGLGLAIVRDVVAAHGGTVDFASRPGEGTTVRVRLPASTASTESTEGAEAGDGAA